MKKNNRPPKRNKNKKSIINEFVHTMHMSPKYYIKKTTEHAQNVITDYFILHVFDSIKVAIFSLMMHSFPIFLYIIFK